MKYKQFQNSIIYGSSSTTITSSSSSFNNNNWLSKYKPPKVPNYFQSCILQPMNYPSPNSLHLDCDSKRTNSERKDDVNVNTYENINNNEKKVESNVRKEEEEEKHTTGTSSTKATTSSTTILKSNFRCNRQIEDLEHRKGSSHLFTSCIFENICLNRKGDWILFTEEDHPYIKPFIEHYFNIHQDKSKENHLPAWVYAHAHGHDFTAARIHVNITKPIRLTRTNTVTTASNGKEEGEGRVDQWSSSLFSNEFKLSKNFQWVSIPTFGFIRHSIANFGHLLLDNYVQIFSNMILYEYLNRDNFVLFLDDLGNDITGGHGRARMDEKIAERFSLEFGQVFSQYTPLQLGFNKFEGWWLGNAPTAKQFESEMREMLDNKAKGISIIPNGNDLVACFSSLVIGQPGSYFMNTEGREVILPLIKNYVLNHYLSSKSVKKQDENEIWIGVHHKPKGTKNRDAIANSKEIVEYLQKQGESFAPRKIKVFEILLESLTFKEQFEMFSLLDVFVSTQGSASYYSLFMKENSYLLYTPMCYHDSQECNDYNLRIHATSPNVKIISLVNHIEIVKCEGQLDKPFRKVKHARSYYGNCNEVLDPKGLHELIHKIITLG
ncbi:hypothetical protein ABK040_011824 [Willaertia magna]